MKKLLLILIIPIIFISCNRERVCTLIGCFSEEPSIPFLIETNEYLNPLYFEDSDLDSFYFIQIDTNNYIHQDSTNIEFGSNIRKNGQFFYIFYLSGTSFKNPIDLRKHNFLLVNRKINFIDTITKINYWEKDTIIICNRCSRPPDEFEKITLTKDFK